MPTKANPIRVEVAHPLARQGLEFPRDRGLVGTHEDVVVGVEKGFGEFEGAVGSGLGIAQSEGVDLASRRPGDDVAPVAQFQPHVGPQAPIQQAEILGQNAVDPALRVGHDAGWIIPGKADHDLGVVCKPGPLLRFQVDGRFVSGGEPDRAEPEDRRERQRSPSGKAVAGEFHVASGDGGRFVATSRRADAEAFRPWRRRGQGG